MDMKRGFTIIEVLIVIIVISILAGIGVAGFSAVRNQAADAEAKSMAAVLTSALNRYYLQNNEYPTAEELNSSPISSYVAASTKLNLSPQSFSTSNVQFSPCSVDMGSTAPASACSFGYYYTMAETNLVKYITKHGNDAAEERSYIVQSPNGPGTAVQYCEVVFKSNVDSRSVYVLALFSREENKVKYIKSLNGSAEFYSPEAGQCVFTAL